MILKKTIFLSNKEKSKSMGILTLESKHNGIFGNLKLYNEIAEPELILGIKYQDKICKQNINLRDKQYSFKLQENLNLEDKLSCVLVKVDDVNISPIVWGYESDNCQKTAIVNSLKESITKIQTKKQNIQNSTKNNLNDENIQDDINQNDTTNNLDNEIHNTHQSNTSDMDNNFDINSYSQISLDEELLSKNIDYNETAYAQQQLHNLFDYNQKEVDSIIDNAIDNENELSSNNQKFYLMIADQLDELFARYPREKNLEALIDNSQWAKIDSDTESKFYVVGIIRDDNNLVKYICYGVPGNYYSEPPQELRGYSQWLPTDTLDPYNHGYWVMYQDSESGENVFIN